MVIKIVSYTYIFMQKLSFLEYPQTLIFVFFCLIYLTFIPVVSYSTNMLLGDIDYTLSRTTLPETLLYGERGLKKMDRKKGELQKCCSDGTKWLTEAAVSFWQPTLPTTTTGWLCSQQSGSGQVTNNTQYTQWTYFFFFSDSLFKYNSRTGPESHYFSLHLLLPSQFVVTSQQMAITVCYLKAGAKFLVFNLGSASGNKWHFSLKSFSCKFKVNV